jgi:DNA polymerase III delta subunit
VQVKDSHELLAKLRGIDITLPPVILVSGSDPSIFDHTVDFIRSQLLKHETVEITLLTGEQEDAAVLVAAAFNLPLFSPYRLFIVKNAEPIFRYILSDERSPDQQNFSSLPERTMLAFYLAGEPSKAMLRLFGDRLLHLHTKNLFAENMEEAIRRTARHLRLPLTEEALLEIRERLPPREGAVQDALKRIKEMHAENQPVTLEEVRDILFPKAGWDMFRLVDACFTGDIHTFSREMMKYSPPEDNFLAVLKQLLNRTDELRRYRICRAHNLSPDETLVILGLKNRHPFIQKKALKRLSEESQRFGAERLERMYEVITETSSAFRLNVPPDHQAVFFEKKVMDIFF